jgi:hypothetical protein
VIARARLGWRGALQIAIAATVACALGVRPATSHASPWSEAEFGGDGRAHLVLHAGASSQQAEAAAATLEAFTRVIFSTQASAFGPGLLLRASFPIPGTRRSAVLVLDLNRAQGRSVWPANEGELLIGRYYEVAAGEAQPSYDGGAEDGELVLERVVVGVDAVGFRITGSVGFIAAGADSLVGTPDDDVRWIVIAMESLPRPEEVAPAPDAGSPLPLVPVCETEVCYEDPYYGYSESSGCGSDGVGVGATPADESGCGGGSSEPDYGYPGEPVDDGGCGGDGGSGDPWTDPTADDGGSGCDGDGSDGEGWDGYDDGSAGCDGDTPSDGWEDTGDACSGDTVAAQPTAGAVGGRGPRPSRGPRGALIAWTPFLLLLASVLLVHRRG